MGHRWGTEVYICFSASFSFFKWSSVLHTFTVPLSWYHLVLMQSRRRLEKRIYIPLPNLETRKELIRINLRTVEAYYITLMLCCLLSFLANPFTDLVMEWNMNTWIVLFWVEAAKTKWSVVWHHAGVPWCEHRWSGQRDRRVQWRWLDKCVPWCFSEWYETQNSRKDAWWDQEDVQRWDFQGPCCNVWF